MSDLTASRAPGWVRIVAALAVLWNLAGVYFYLVSVGAIAGAAEADMVAMPAWATGAHAVAVFAGVLGSLGLLMLKGWSRLLLGLSLLAVLALDVWLFGMSGTPIDGSTIVMPVIVTLIAILLFWISQDGVKKGWLS